MKDVIIIGGGPSGLTAALYSLREGKSVLIIEKENFGGQISISPRVENFPSIKEISGMDLSDKMFTQVLDLGAEYELDEVKEIKKEENGTFKIKCVYAEFEARTVIIATGLMHRKLGLPKEDELVGKGISYCAVCDGAFYKNDEVAVIGDSNTGLQYALHLSNYASKVYLISKHAKLKAENTLANRVLENNKIEIHFNSITTALLGENEVSGIAIQNIETKDTKFINVKGIFVAIGHIPSNEIFEDLVDLDEKGFILTNDKMETKTPGLYAAGDCRKKDVKQVITACNDGAIAALEASKYLN